MFMLLTAALQAMIGNQGHKARPYPYIQREFQLLKNALPTIHLRGEDDAEANEIEQEINLVIQRKVEEIGAKLELEDQECSFLKRELLLIPNRTYLWVTLIFDMIENTLSYTNNRLRAMIKTLPRTIDEAYERILNQSQDREIAYRLLHIVVGAIRPLTVKEMRVALAVDPAHSEYASLDLEPEARFAKTVRNLCGLFVTIVDEQIYLLHQTAKEFLVSVSLQQKSSLCENAAVSDTVHELREHCEDSNAGLGRWKHSLHLVETSRVLLEICLSYLQLDIFTQNQSNDSPNPRTDERAFVPYSAIHWTIHFRQANLGVDSKLLQLVRKICPPIDDEVPDNGRTALSFAAERGSGKIARMLINHGTTKLDAQDRLGRTPLIWAAQSGHIEMIRLLLGQQEAVDVNRFSFHDRRTALWHAIYRGREDIVALLLDSGANALGMAPFNGRDRDPGDRLKPHGYAALKGHEGIVKLLLRITSLDPNCRDHLNRSPLSLATEAGHTGVVTLLIKTGAVHLDSKDNVLGRTPLLWAAAHEHEEIIRHLIEAGAKDIECAGRSPSRTALSYQSERGNAALVKLLLGTGLAEPDSQSTDRRTPLSYACENGHGSIVELLLGTGVVDVNSQSIYGRTPLSYACERGHAHIVRQLLALEVTEPDLADRSYGRTPLSWAAARGHREVAQLLLDTSTVDLASTDFNYRRTPAMWAAANKYEELARLLQHTGLD
ncbi:ankyrin repeat-containing domain protein [Aspergillus pseudoustus]|uniref:protein S-acyltransferase n=1 Tax=Aspergillus pseudoustus TaxID=1810923 RepID=A0ABR4IQ56_9EURO